MRSEKIRAGVFDDLQIRKLVKAENFVIPMDSIEEAWNSLVIIVNSFLVNNKVANLTVRVDNLLENFQI